MSDPRLTAFNGRVAHISLKGQVDAERFVEGEAHRVGRIVSDLCRTPKGPRDRQLLQGEAFQVLDLVDGWAYGIAGRDGYVGWIDADALIGPKEPPTHRISAARSYGKSTPGLKTMGQVEPLPFGAQLAVIEQVDDWARVACSRGILPRDIYIPMQHLAPVGWLEVDPVSVAERLLGTPYLWGGNSSFGIDCSGLVQAGLLACGKPCPGDSDLQQAELGKELASDAAPVRGDLVFWKGHVAMFCDATTLIHANAHHMSVVLEPFDAACERIAASGGGAVTARKRV
jgi:hypothetical protein